MLSQRRARDLSLTEEARDTMAGGDQQPRIITLERAVAEIHAGSEEEARARRTRPFFFIAGAGISYPPVPLAGVIETHCRERAESLGIVGDPPVDSPVDRYSHWFDAAYAQPRHRQSYLRSLIEGKLISHANFRLAHLLLGQRTLANIVVTPNFDDFLSRALTLFGQPHVVCDHPRTTERIDPEQDDIQIIHVHGSYWLYDCINLRDELALRAQPSATTIQTMAAALDGVLRRRTPIVLGYSGWEGDVIMGALRRRLEIGLQYNLYWFCFRRDAIDGLPGWLKNHPQVRLVAPPPRETNRHPAERLLTSTSAANPASDQELLHALPASSDQADDSSSLPAHRVLDALIRAFSLAAPPLTSDPLAFYADQLQASLIADSVEPSRDTYFISSVIRRIRRAHDLELQDREASVLQLDAVLDAVRRSAYGEAIAAGRPIDLQSFERRQLQNFFDALLSSALGLDDNSPDVIEGCDRAIAAGELLMDGTAPADEARISTQVARLLIRKGYVLIQLKRLDEAVAACDAMVARFDTATAPGLQMAVAFALGLKGSALGRLERLDKAVAAYDEVVARFGTAAAPGLLEAVARALVTKGIALGQLGRLEEALAVYDKVVARFGAAAAPGLQMVIAFALGLKGASLARLERIDKAVAAYDDVVARFDKATEPGLRKAVTMARELTQELKGAGAGQRGEKAKTLKTNRRPRAGAPTTARSHPQAGEQAPSEPAVMDGPRSTLRHRTRTDLRADGELPPRVRSRSELL